MAATDYNANVTQGSNSVDIMITMIEHNFDKMLTDIQVPDKSATPDSWLIDLRRLKEVITVTGWLQDEGGSTGLAKKTVLRTILQTAGTMTLAWGTSTNAQSYTVNVLKGSIKEMPGRKSDSVATLGSETKTFDVMIQFIIGTHKG